MMNNVINQRITTLRELMKREKLSAFIFPSTDPHNGEYVPAHWEGRKWISGFDGSAGIAVVTMDKAALWTDSRYFIAAKRQLSGTEYVLMKEKIPGTPTISEWLSINLAHLVGPEIGIDGMVSSANTIENLIYEMRRGGGITGLVTLIWSGLKPSQVSTLAALDSIRLQSELAKHFGVAQSDVTGCRTYGGHGEAMAVFASTAKVAGTPLTDLIGTAKLTNEQWADIKQKTIQGGSNIIKLRGRSSFQSPAYVSVRMIEAAMGGEEFTWPAGRYVSFAGIDHIMMAMEVTITKNGSAYEEVVGTAEEMDSLKKSYEHLVAMRQEVIDLGVVPPVEKWGEINPNLK